MKLKTLVLKYLPMIKQMLKFIHPDFCYPNLKRIKQVFECFLQEFECLLPSLFKGAIYYTYLYFEKASKFEKNLGGFRGILGREDGMGTTWQQV